MQNTLSLFNEIVERMLKEERTAPVATYIPAEALFETLDLSLPQNPIIDEDFSKALMELVLSTPKTATSAFFNQLFGGRNDKAILGDLLAVMLNNSMYTYKAAGAQIGVEKILIETINKMIGWEDSGSGTIAPGGSMTNFMALLMARDRYAPKVRCEGMNKPMTLYTSTESHYSMAKNASFAGLGRNQVRYIAVNTKGEMLPDALEVQILEDIANGFTPCMVNATAGTTVLGAFDAIAPLANLCKKHDIWLHVDGAYCGSVIFSKRYKHLLDGLELADSFSLNAHKMLGTPLSCSLIMVRNKAQLYTTFSNEADYLYQTDEDEFNPGKTSLQCGRRNDALKFWTLWKSVGTSGLEAIVDKQFELANAAREYVESHPDYTLYSYEDSISVCFNYKNIDARELCTMLYEKSQLLVGYGNFNDSEFIRLVTINAQNDKEDIINFFKVIENFVRENESLFCLKA